MYQRCRFETKAELDAKARGARVTRTKWCGPGMYYIKEYKQPCPRGCCYDDVFESYTPSEVIDEVVDQMRDLAYQLRTARKDQKESQQQGESSES